MALTVRCRNYWPGCKPIASVGGNKSQSGKGTVVVFICGHDEPVSISYDATDWALEKTVVSHFAKRPDLPVLVLDNLRLDGRAGAIRSACLERLIHDPEPSLYAPGAGSPVSIPAHFVTAVTANQAVFSEDLMNRSVSIRRELRGDPALRQSAIGDPKHEYLPRNRDRIDAELWGMVERWKAAGRPLDLMVRHPFLEWAQTVGGILKVSGFTHFLANRVEHRTADDPVRRALALIGAEYPGVRCTATEWTPRIVGLGLVEALIPRADRGSAVARALGAGVTFANYLD
jgi:hypothetical protein